MRSFTLRQGSIAQAVAKAIQHQGAPRFYPFVELRSLYGMKVSVHTAGRRARSCYASATLLCVHCGVLTSATLTKGCHLCGRFGEDDIMILQYENRGSRRGGAGIMVTRRGGEA